METSISSGHRSAYGTERELAEYLGLARITAQTRRLKGKDWPAHYKVGNRILYKWSDVETWMAARKVGGK